MNDIFDGEGCGCGCGCHDAAPRPADMPDWSALEDSTMVCHCQGISKAQIIKAIETGAYTLALVEVMTGAGRGKECAEASPLGRSCEADIEELIRLYGGKPPRA